MVEKRDRIRHLIRAAVEGEKFTIRTLSQTPDDPKRYPEISDCFAQALENARSQIDKLHGFLDPGAASLDSDILPASTWHQEALPRDAVDSLAAVHSCERLHLTLYRMLLAAAGDIGDIELEQLCSETLWIKDAMAARLAIELANLDTEYGLERLSPRSGKDEPAPSITPAPQSAVAIRRTAPGRVEVTIQVRVEAGLEQSEREIYAQAWALLADAIDEHAEDPTPAGSKRRTGTKTSGHVPPGSAAWS